MLTAVTVALALYVLYAHASSSSVLSQALRKPWTERFSSPAEFARDFEVRTYGNISHRIDAGTLHVEGRSIDAKGSPSYLEFIGAPQRLGDVRLRMRFRANGDGAFDVSVGLHGEGRESRAIRFGLANGATAGVFRLVGDVGPFGKQAEGDRVLAEARVPSYAADAWHELDMRISPSIHQALLSVDGNPVASGVVFWEDGTRVRPVLGVYAREPNANVDLDVSEVAFEPVDPDTRFVDVDDTFNGRVIDPASWRVIRPDDRKTRLSMETGHGLTFHAVALERGAGGFTLMGPTHALESFDAAVDVEITKLDHAAVFFGVANLGFDPSFRMFDVGISAGGEGANAFMNAHLAADGQGRYRDLRSVEVPALVHIEMSYDATTHRGRVRVDDTEAEEDLALRPLEDVIFRIGTALHSPDAMAEGRIARVSFRRHAYRP
ncbi:hypothetical protein LVJ94_15465 [Pendulispora rubella]|uniref:3-keto-disaccharide hydrolase domain-containing protein n=1 Tax=Pendulispora rubella TaxID=2741070 RepID=A0ABZ2LCH4_9BACT